MPTIPYVHQTWTDGVSALSAARMNVIEDGVFNISFAPAVRVFHNTTQSIANNTLTALAFNSERFDQAANAADTMHDTVTNNSRLTCRYAGVYQITGFAQWPSSPTAGEIHVRLNGTTLIGGSLVVADNRFMHVSTLYSMAVNDYVELLVKQTSGVALNVSSTANESPEFMMVRVA